MCKNDCIYRTSHYVYERYAKMSYTLAELPRSQFYLSVKTQNYKALQRKLSANLHTIT